MTHPDIQLDHNNSMMNRGGKRKTINSNQSVRPPQSETSVDTYNQDGYDVIVETTTTRTYKRKHDDSSVPRNMATAAATTTHSAGATSIPVSASSPPPASTGAAALAVYRKSLRDGTFISPSLTGVGIPDRGSDTAAVRAAAKDLSLNLWFPENEPSSNATRAAVMASSVSRKDMESIEERAREQREGIEQYTTRPPHPDAASAATYAPFQMLIEEKQIEDQMTNPRVMTLDNQNAKLAAVSALRFGDQPQDLAKQALPDAYAWGEREQGSNRDSYMGISGPELGAQAIHNVSQDKKRQQMEFEGFSQGLHVENQDPHASRAAAFHARSAAQSVTRNIDQNIEGIDRTRQELHENAMPDASLGASRANALARDKSIRQARASSFKQSSSRRNTSDYGALDNVSQIEAQARERARKRIDETYAAQHGGRAALNGRQRSVSLNTATAGNSQAAKTASLAATAAARRTSTFGSDSAALAATGSPRSASQTNLFDVAQRNVSRTMIAQDRNMSESQLFLNTDYNARAWQIAESRAQKRLGNHSKIDVGGGLFMTEEEINRIAQRNVQPVLSEIHTKSVQQREDDELARQQHANSKEAKKAHKAEQKRLKAQQAVEQKAEKARLKAQKKHSKESAKAEKAKLKAQQEEAKLIFESARAEVRRTGTVRTRALAELEAAKIAQNRAKDPTAVERAALETERKQQAYDDACAEFSHAQSREEAGLRAMEKASDEVAAAAVVSDTASASATREAATVATVGGGAGAAGATTLTRETSTSSSTSTASYHTTNEVNESGMLGRNRSMRSVKSNRSRRSLKRKSKVEPFVPAEPGTPHPADAYMPVAPLPITPEVQTSKEIVEEEEDETVAEPVKEETPAKTEGEILTEKARAEAASQRSALESGVADSSIPSARPGGVVGANGSGIVAGAGAGTGAAVATTGGTAAAIAAQEETPATNQAAIEHTASGETKEYSDVPPVETAKEALEPLETAPKKGVGSWFKNLKRKSKDKESKKKSKSKGNKKAEKEAVAAASVPVSTPSEPTTTTGNKVEETAPAVVVPTTADISEPVAGSLREDVDKDEFSGAQHEAHGTLERASEAEVAGAGHQRHFSGVIKTKEDAQLAHSEAIKHGVATMHETASRTATPISGTPRAHSPEPDIEKQLAGSKLNDEVPAGSKLKDEELLTSSSKLKEEVQQLNSKASKSSMATSGTAAADDEEDGGSRAAKVSFNRVRQ